MEAVKNFRPPAITTGLVPFQAILYFLGLGNTLSLTPDALFRLDLNRISFYPLVYVNLLHFIVGVCAFLPLCGQFELCNGTVRTGIMLNVTAVFTGLIDNLIVKVLGDRARSETYSGPAVWILAFSAQLSVTKWTLPVIPISNFIVSVPPWLLPVVAYALLTLFTPAFWLIYLIALLMGFGFGTGRLGFLVEGSTNVVAWIESKLERGIAALRYIVRFVGEVDARDIRRSLAFRTRRSSSIVADEIPLPAASLTNPASN